ncbi:MAG: 2-oxo acid dehydrogenase subunit E2 [Deltaproteobacteria bacterium]|nr:2-oxo acid dehydrogenase subunit E2 [Deltaproteobacteria bacterium]MBW2285068.1 2-oxo acid dehydrogenase subunit E2 [Deltaproteobacteria bacterium]
MAREFKLPDLGEGVHEGEVLKVLVSIGDEVKEGDPILEVETDKAAVEIPSPFTGKVAEIRVKEGETVRVGDVLMTFGIEGDQESAPEEAVKKPEVEPHQAEKGVEPSEEAASAPKHEGPVPASPATRRLARELGVDLHNVGSSGPGGLVTAEDVRSFVEKGGAAEALSPSDAPEERAPTPGQVSAILAPAVAAPPLPDFQKWGPVERIPLRSIRKATARQMSLAWSQIPHVHNEDLVDVTQLDEFRRKHKAEIEEKGGKLSFTVFALKAAATALKTHPQFNATLDTANGEIILKQYFHIGVAVNTDDGLIVPVVRDVDRKSILELSIELTELVERTRRRKVKLDEMQGGTFTITNVGPMGGGFFAPIINYPEVAIMGMGGAKLQPVVVSSADGNHDIVPRLMMPLILCIDHRVLDGAHATAFMRTVKEALEDPEELFITMT